MERRGAGLLAAIVLLAAGLDSAAAQEKAGGDQQAPPSGVKSTVRAPVRAHAFQVSVSAQWLGSSPLGAATATMTANQTGSPGTLTYFQTDARLQSAAGLEARLGYTLTRRLAVEGGFAYSRPNVRLTIANDFENVSDATFDAERLSQYLVDAGVVFSLRPGAGRRTLPFLQGGVGYLRQLHETNTLADTGQVYYGGAGVTHLFAVHRDRRLSGLGIRADLRVCYRHDGFTFSTSGRVYPAIGGGLFLAF